MSHYETLGVGKGATPEEIKKAYRRAASKAHPDRHGGDGKQMVAVNTAYETLSDASKREYYDLHGEDEPVRKPLETRALQLIYQMLMQIVAQTEPNQLNICTLIVDNLKANRANVAAGKVPHERTIAKLEKFKKLLKRKQPDAENMLWPVFDQTIGVEREKIAEINEALEPADLAIEIMKDYEYTGKSQAYGSPSGNSVLAALMAQAGGVKY